MDEFGLDRPELTGSLITMEFGAGGRIQQLWAADPDLPEERDEFEFVLSPITFGGEFAEDYFPGTILLGARTHTEEPWILSRNVSALPIGEDEEEGGDPLRVAFQYHFPLLPEIEATGTFYEAPGALPQICWDVTLHNRGRVSIEIGELAFPMALNNLYESPTPGEGDSRAMFLDKVHVHKFIGGSASHLFAQRLSGDLPGLVVFPGTETTWEFFNHVPASLNTHFRWEGIPVVYVYSRAVVEREKWATWFYDHTSLVLEAGDSRTVQTRFVPAERGPDGALQALQFCGQPVIKVLPGAVAPVDVGVAVEVAGTTPTSFVVSRDAELETDMDEDGGFCFIRPSQAGPVKLTIEDSKGRASTAHLLFTENIESLVKARARWILDNQQCDDPSSTLYRALVMTDVESGEKFDQVDAYGSAFALEGSLSDALFLAEKNAIYPDRAQIATLDAFVTEFLQDDVQNPADGAVGSTLSELGSVALNFGRANMYPRVANLYQSMARIAQHSGGLPHDASGYRRLAWRTWMALFRYAVSSRNSHAGIPGYATVFDLLEELEREGMEPEAAELRLRVEGRARDLLRHKFPFGSDGSGFGEAFATARYLRDEGQRERAVRCALAARSLAPCWWWYGSDKRLWEDPDGADFPIVIDHGELCLGGQTPGNSGIFFNALDRDYAFVSDGAMRLAFGGMLGVWALVRADGAASMGFCPDAASRHHGFSVLTGDVGAALFDYLRFAGSYVLPNRDYGVYTFGCHFEAGEEAYTVRPWDGVMRRVVMRQIGAEFRTSFGLIREVTLDLRKRWAHLTMENPSDREVHAELRVHGLWGERVTFLGKTYASVDGEVTVPITLPKLGTVLLELEVVQ